jgi:hypothetical protein
VTGRIIRLTAVAALTAAAFLPVTPARAQGMTPAADVEPPTYTFRLGPMLLGSGLTLEQAGVDSNIFVEETDPQEDFVVTLTPDASVYLRPQYVRLTGYFGADFNSFHTFSDQNYVAPTLKGRGDFFFGRFRPYAGGARTDTRDRPNHEIDARARRLDSEIGGGLAFEVSPQTLVYVSATRLGTRYHSGETFDGVALDDLNRDAGTYDAGIRLDLTPLTSLALFASYSEDRFLTGEARDSDSRTVSALFTFAPDAMFTGTARIGVRDFRPEDPALEPFTGVTATVAITWPLVDRGTLVVSILRDVQYSYEQAEGYYVDTTEDVSYTHRIFGPLDLQGRAAFTRLNYGDRVDGVTLVSGGAGYTLPGPSRLGVTYEWSERSSDRRADRRYDRTRVFLTWAYTF